MPTNSDAIKVSNVAVNSPFELSFLQVVSMNAAIRAVTQKAYLSSKSNTEILKSNIDMRYPHFSDYIKPPIAVYCQN